MISGATLSGVFAVLAVLGTFRAVALWHFGNGWGVVRGVLYALLAFALGQIALELAFFGRWPWGPLG